MNPIRCEELMMPDPESMVPRVIIIQSDDLLLQPSLISPFLNSAGNFWSTKGTVKKRDQKGEQDQTMWTTLSPVLTREENMITAEIPPSFRY